jgi:hypothetical protein
MPDPVGQPDVAMGGASEPGPPFRTGSGETDWTLAALHTAAASFAGPGTSLLVGIAQHELDLEERTLPGG